MRWEAKMKIRVVSIESVPAHLKFIIKFIDSYSVLYNEQR